jgi:hypothetical protein
MSVLPRREDREWRRQYDNQRYNERRKKLIDALDGKCVLCGGEHDLHFHHEDMGTKRFSIGNSWGKNWNDVIEEMLKCQLLCFSCHMKLHHPNPPAHGTLSRYGGKYRCRCEECRAHANQHSREYKRNRRKMGM